MSPTTAQRPRLTRVPALLKAPTPIDRRALPENHDAVHRPALRKTRAVTRRPAARKGAAAVLAGGAR
ncbi:hypothetical protein GCM10018965_045120 [Nonomuraea roseola]